MFEVLGYIDKFDNDNDIIGSSHTWGNYWGEI